MTLAGMTRSKWAKDAPEMLLHSLSLEDGLRLRRSETEMLLSPLGLGNPANGRCS